MSQAGTRDYFDKARSVAAAFLIAAGAAAIIGSFLEWVTIEPPGVVPEEQAHRLDAFTGVEANDGWVVVTAAAILIVFTLMLVVRRRAIWAWGAFFLSMLIGGIAVADYRGIDRLFYDEMQRIGDPSPALGLTLVAAAGFIGLIASAAAVAATPSPD